MHATLMAWHALCRSLVSRVWCGMRQSPELLAKYCDSIMKSSNKRMSASEIEHGIDQVVLLFKYIADKDVFQRMYSQGLARRLIYSMSYSDEIEAHALNGLKQVCGYEYTSRLQRMFADVAGCNALNLAYQEFASAKPDAAKQIGACVCVRVRRACDATKHDLADKVRARISAIAHHGSDGHVVALDAHAGGL